MARIICIIDMQKDFIDGSLGTPEAQIATEKAVKWLKENLKDGDIVYLTQDSHYQNYLDTPEGKKLPIKHCICGTEGYNVWPDIWKCTCIYCNQIFNKHTFGSKNLINAIKSKIISYNIKEIIFMGLCTDICVVSNVLMAKEALENKFDIPIKVLSECCAGVTPEKHEAALEVMRSCQIDVI